MTGIRGLSLGNVGPYSRTGGPGKQHYPVTVDLLLLSACLSLAGPERAAEAHGPSLSWPAHCQGSAFTGMYGQDGTLHFANPGKKETERTLRIRQSRVDYSGVEGEQRAAACALKPQRCGK